MIWVVLVLVVLVLILLIGVAGLLANTKAALDHYDTRNDRNRILTIQALALEDAAQRWDSVDEQPYLQTLSKQYQAGGHSMPNLWLTDRAKRIWEEVDRGLRTDKAAD